MTNESYDIDCPIAVHQIDVQHLPFYIKRASLDYGIVEIEFNGLYKLCGVYSNSSFEFSIGNRLSYFHFGALGVHSLDPQLIVNLYETMRIKFISKPYEAILFGYHRWMDVK